MKNSTLSIFIFLLSVILLTGCGSEKKNANKASNTNTSINNDENERLSEEEITASNDVDSENNEPLFTEYGCNASTFDLMYTILESVDSLSGTPYSQANKTDCSGMFHKVLDSVRMVCPDANLPSINNARSTRGIAKWYNEKGQLTIVRNPAKSQHLIKPGMVMFYGYGSRASKYDRQTMNIDTLMTRGIGINHVAIVTSVEIVDGKVISYDIFHGRNPRYPAGITSSESDDTPVYGNGPEPWLAIAEMLTPVN